MNPPRPKLKPPAVTVVTAGFASGLAVLPFNVTSEQASRLIGSAKIFRRLRHAAWLVPLEPSAPGRPSLYPYSRLVAVQARLELGEFPPLLPSEVKFERARKAAAAARIGSSAESAERRSVA